MVTILVVEDDPPLREGLVYNLTHQDYTVESTGDGKKAIEIARRIRPDLILLDIMLPGLDGFEVCRVLRQEMSCPILMLTARAEEIDRIIGLEIGADDYIMKPFSMRELLARIKAHLRHERLVLSRRSDKDVEDDTKGVLTFRNLVIDLGRKEVTLDDRPLALKPKEFDLLRFMAKHQGEALSREYLLEKVWGWQYFSDTHTVDVHIHWLRVLIEVNPQNPVRLVTVRGSGYRFEG